MILIGRYLSPFVRRVGATLYLYGLPFEHRPMMAFGDDKERLREWNPVTRVPALVVDDGEVLVDSAANREDIARPSMSTSASPTTPG